MEQLQNNTLGIKPFDFYIRKEGEVNGFTGLHWDLDEVVSVCDAIFGADVSTFSGKEDQKDGKEIRYKTRCI